MSNLFNPPKYVFGSLSGVDGNAFALMAHFTQCARKSGWGRDEIEKVIKAAQSGNYDNLITVLDSHME